jgi:hypothetical protein
MTVACFARNFAIGGACLLGGCDPFFPSFEGPLGIDKSTAYIPVGVVAKRVQCELTDFISDPNYQWLLDPNGKATLSLKLETDHAGKVTWVGIDLSKLGPLASLNSLVAITNKVPSLQASGQVKSTITSQLDFNISQNPKNYTDCSTIERSFFRYYLKDWLADFVKNLKQDKNYDSPSLCMTKITLNTGFNVVLDVNGGLTPITPATLVLPISGTNFDYSPTFAHSLNIALTVRHQGDAAKNPLCSAPATEGATAIHP